LRRASLNDSRWISGSAEVLTYLGRHTNRLTIANGRTRACDQEYVRLTWKDYRDDGAVKTVNLKPDEFISTSRRGPHGNLQIPATQFADSLAAPTLRQRPKLLGRKVRTRGPTPCLSAELTTIVETVPDRKDDAATPGCQIDLKRVIAERFGVDYHELCVGKLLRKLGFSHPRELAAPPISATKASIYATPFFLPVASGPPPLPYADPEAIQLHLEDISRHIADGANAVLLLDGGDDRPARQTATLETCMFRAFSAASSPLLKLSSVHKYPQSP
jgi:Putative transposase